MQVDDDILLNSVGLGNFPDRICGDNVTRYIMVNNFSRNSRRLKDNVKNNSRFETGYL